MKKKAFLTLLGGICLVLATVLACAPAPTPTPVKPVTLSLSTFDPPTAYLSPVLVAWAEEFEEKTNGRYKVEIAWGGAMGSYTEQYDLVRTGVADIAFVMPAVIPGLFPVSSVMLLPIISDSYYIGSEAYQDVYKKGYLDNEFADVEVLFLWAGEGSVVYTSKEPITTFADFEGTKIATESPIRGQVARALGAVPVSIPLPDYYGATEKGTVDGVWFTWSGILPWNLSEVLHYALDPPRLSTWPNALVMNKDTYSKMPEDVKTIVDEMRDSGRYTMLAAKAGDQECVRGREAFLNAGGKMAGLSAADMAEMDKRVRPLWDKWIAEGEAKGLPMKDILNELYSTLTDLGVEEPFLGYTPGS